MSDSFKEKKCFWNHNTPLKNPITGMNISIKADIYDMYVIIELNNMIKIQGQNFQYKIKKAQKRVVSRQQEYNKFKIRFQNMKEWRKGSRIHQPTEQRYIKR